MIHAPNPYLNVFGRAVPWYGIMFAVGMLVGGLASAIRGKKRKIDRFDAVVGAVFAAVGGLIGAKLMAIFGSIDAIAYYRIPFIDVMRGGFVFYGGLIGGFIGLVVYCKIYKESYTDYLDSFAVSVPLGHVFGRIGCFIAGCCHGKPYDGWLSVTYTHALDGNTPLGQSLLAVQLIESFSLLILYIILEVVYYKANKKGLPTCLYIIGYSAIRFTLEFFRADEARGGGFIFNMSTSQLISVLLVSTMVVTLIYLYLRKRYDDKKEGYADALTSAVMGSISFILSLILVLCSTSNIGWAECSTNMVYCVLMWSLNTMMFIKGIRRYKKVQKLKAQGEKTLLSVETLSFSGMVISALGMLYTLVATIQVFVALGVLY
ncbi:MAG: prolipoprotein diacylglyceryl transferase [Clostridia bacterium]|nr:prolipoprotein diacylglyceryl transferase [Clostridia bacterium]